MDYSAVVLRRASDVNLVGIEQQSLAAAADLIFGFLCQLPWRQDTTDGQKQNGLCNDLVIGFVPRRW